MPPAFVLSQDQTLKLCHSYLQNRTKIPQPTNNQTPGADYLHLSNVMDTKDMQNNRLDLNYASEPEAPKTQTPSPTCPFIYKPTMSKNRATSAAPPLPIRIPNRRGKRPSSVTAETVNPYLVAGAEIGRAHV